VPYDHSPRRIEFIADREINSAITIEVALRH
jgi:hypothetical protein